MAEATGAADEQHGRANRRRLMAFGAAYLTAALLWLAATFLARARWFDLRCLRLDESSRSMEWMAWFPPHFACLDAHGQVLVRDYSETVWLSVIWGPVLVLGCALGIGVWRRRR